MPQAQASTKQNVVEPLEPKAAMLEMVQVVENKKRNLEKRKQKLEILEAKPADQLTEQQKEAVTHIGEVNGNIQYVEEILVRFREIQLQVDKWVSIEAKKEKLASKKSAKKNGESAPTQNESAVHNVHHEASADATPPSRGSVCEAVPAVGESEKTSTVQNVPAATELTTSTTNETPAPAVEPAAPAVENSHEQQGEEHLQDAEVPQRDEVAPAEEDGPAPKETITFVNSQAEAANANAQADDERAFSAPSGRYHHGGPRRDFRQHDGPRGGYGYGQQYGRPPRRGGRGPYRGPRGPPRGGPAPNAGANVPPAAAGSRAGEFRGG